MNIAERVASMLGHADPASWECRKTSKGWRLSWDGFIPAFFLSKKVAK